MVAPPDNDVLWARGLTYAHDGSPALQGVSMGVREGEILAVTGPRGSGKTTLLRCLSGQLRVRQGEVWFNSVPVHTMGPLARERLRLDRFGWIDPEPVLVPELNAWENTALPLMLRGTGRRAAKAAALEWLERLDIRDAARKRPHALLQSERQRVVVARALVSAPTVLFADEPTAPLHRAEHTHVLRTLTTAARSHAITVVLATHDPETAALADRTVSLLDGRRIRTVHLPTPPGGEHRAATEADRGTTAPPEAEPDRTAAGASGHRPAGAGSAPCDRRVGPPADTGSDRPSGAGAERPAEGGPNRPPAKQNSRPIAEQAGGTGTGTEAEGTVDAEAERVAAGSEGEGTADAEGERTAGADRDDRAVAGGDDRTAVEGEGRAACSLSV